MSTENLSSYYDSNIVYVIDEILLRGPFHVFLKWFCEFLSAKKYPGYICCVGYTEESQVQRYLPPSMEYFKLQKEDNYPIFNIKVSLNFPNYIILISVGSSLLFRRLCCDGTIELNLRESIRQNIALASKTIDYLNCTYFKKYVELRHDNEIECSTLLGDKLLLTDPGTSCYEKENATRNTDSDDERSLISDNDDDVGDVDESMTNRRGGKKRAYFYDEEGREVFVENEESEMKRIKQLQNDIETFTRDYTICDNTLVFEREV